MKEKTKFKQELREHMGHLQDALVDRDTNLGMNESYRQALDDVRRFLTEDDEIYYAEN